MKKCNFCGNAHVEFKKVEYIYRRDGNYLIVSDVPCEECTFCGERYYEAQVLRKIEHEFNILQRADKKPAKTISMPIEKFALI
ncbi:MAG: type II toxin-antitoxin system MqsA family antitoxin [Pseudomonadota bacterium]